MDPKGICFTSESLVVTDIDRVWKLDPEAENPTPLAEGLQSAAGHSIDEKAGVVIIPDMKAGALVFYPLAPGKR